MTDLPVLTARELIAALARAGMVPVRQKGSHVILQAEDGRHTVVPVHPREDLDRRLLERILKQCGLSRDDLLELLR